MVGSGTGLHLELNYLNEEIVWCRWESTELWGHSLGSNPDSTAYYAALARTLSFHISKMEMLQIWCGTQSKIDTYLVMNNSRCCLCTVGSSHLRGSSRTEGSSPPSDLRGLKLSLEYSLYLSSVNQCQVQGPQRTFWASFSIPSESCGLRALLPLLSPRPCPQPEWEEAWQGLTASGAQFHYSGSFPCR